MRFNKRQTNIAKGVAVLLLLWHHLFYNVPYMYDFFVPFYKINDIPIECIISDFCKVCVAIFLVLSGFGLYKSWEKKVSSIIRGGNYKGNIKIHFLFVKDHLLKLLFSFWFIYIVFVPLSILVGTPFWETYQGNVIYGIIDFLGLAYLFGTPTINTTWWFMSPIIIYYIIFPTLIMIINYCDELLLVVSAFILLVPIFNKIPGQLSMWLFPFAIGMYLAKNNLFCRLDKKINTYPKKSMFVGCSIICTAIIRCFNSDLDTLFALSIIIASFFIISRVPIISSVFENIGKHSGAIFMFHTFVQSDFRGFVYWFRYPLAIFLVFTMFCYIVSVGLDYLKNLSRYDKLVAKLVVFR